MTLLAIIVGVVWFLGYIGGVRYIWNRNRWLSLRFGNWIGTLLFPAFWPVTMIVRGVWDMVASISGAVAIGCLVLIGRGRDL